MKKTRVFLGNAPWSKRDYYGVRAGSRWPHFESEDMTYMPFPFFLAYATAVLENAGFPVMLVDGIAEGIVDKAFYDRIEDFKPDVILLEVSTNSWKKDEQHITHITQQFPQAKLFLAGLHDEMYQEAFLQQHPEVFGVLIGEYEFAFQEALERIEAGVDVVGTKGVIARDGDKIVNTGQRPLEPKLEVFPWPARHFLPMYNYRDEPGNLPRPSVQMWASRGCPYHCTFCAWPQIMYRSHKYRFRKVEDIVDEMEWLHYTYGFKSAYFDDDTFNIGKSRMMKFAKEVKSRNMDMHFGIMSRADLMDREILEALKDAGLWGLKYGVESASQQILDNCKKDLKIDDVVKGVEMTHAVGVKMHMTFMFGLPGETLETAKQTTDLAIQLAPDSVQFTVATPFPGTAYWHEVNSEQKLTSTDFDKYDGFRSAVVRTDSLTSDQLEQCLREANRRWNEFRWNTKNYSGTHRAHSA